MTVVANLLEARQEWIFEKVNRNGQDIMSLWDFMSWDFVESVLVLENKYDLSNVLR